MMGALVEVDDARVTRYAREHDLATGDALARLLDEAVAAAERAGSDVVEDGKQELVYTRADIDPDRPATVSAGAGFRGDRERASLAFDRWNEALAERATILRTFLRGEDIVREWVDDAFQEELDAGWSEEKEEEIRQLIESGRVASAAPERRQRSWLRDWGQAARYPWRTRALLAVSFAFFGLVFGALARLDATWSVLLAVLLGALVGLAFAEHGIRVARRTAAASIDTTRNSAGGGG